MPAKTKSSFISEGDVTSHFTEIVGAHALYDHSKKAWYTWNDDRYCLDTIHTVDHIMYEASCNMAASVDRPEQMKKSSFVGGALRLATFSPSHSVTSDCWDQNDWLLGCPGGTVTLRDGAVLPPDPDHLITLQTSVAPAQNADCPLFEAFMLECARGDIDLVRFMQRWLGYCLTGDMREQKLVYVYGPGGNGKGVLFRLILSVMDSYAKPAAESAFLKRRNESHPTDLADLAGARIVTISETEAGGQWREQVIKGITGQDSMKARFMRGNFFTFTPMCKLMFSGNNPPELSQVDDAARRRFLIVPFLHRPKEIDSRLEEKLRAELPGILRWMINGCLEWQRIGLAPPAAVTNETARYFQEQNVLENWMEDVEVVMGTGPAYFAPASELYRSWKTWCEERNEEAGNIRSFGQALTSSGCGTDRRRIDGKTTVVRTGIAFIQSVAQYDPIETAC